MNDELACHGYLIDESWLIAARECLLLATSNKNNKTDNNWTAEISHDDEQNEGDAHDDDAHSTRRRRRVKDIHVPDESEHDARDGSTAPIVLAKLEKPVRFR